MGIALTQTLDITDRETFVEEMIPYVKYLAHRIAVGLPASVDIEDLVHYGVLGLLDACDKFDAEKGVKFKTYAETRIRGAMLDGMRAADWVPRSVRKKRRALEEAYRKVEQNTMRPAEDEEVAEALSMNLNEFQALLTDVAGLSLGSLEELLPEGEDRGLLLRYGAKTDEGRSPFTSLERNELRSILVKSIEALPDKERMVLSLYYYEELTMKEIGNVLGISESRVSQLHTKAILRIRTRLHCRQSA
jgi:RNA polymerase sigma factor for flagellar operon FliA